MNFHIGRQVYSTSFFFCYRKLIVNFFFCKNFLYLEVLSAYSVVHTFTSLANCSAKVEPSFSLSSFDGFCWKKPVIDLKFTFSTKNCFIRNKQNDIQTEGCKIRKELSLPWTNKYTMILKANSNEWLHAIVLQYYVTYK